MPFRHTCRPCYLFLHVTSVGWIASGEISWDGNSKRKKYHSVKWRAVMSGKKTGDMGIKNLKVHSKVLKMKWLWKYSTDQNQLRGRVIKSKYDQEDNWMTKKVTTPYG